LSLFLSLALLAKCIALLDKSPNSLTYIGIFTITPTFSIVLAKGNDLCSFDSFPASNGSKGIRLVDEL